MEARVADYSSRYTFNIIVLHHGIRCVYLVFIIIGVRNVIIEHLAPKFRSTLSELVEAALSRAKYRGIPQSIYTLIVTNDPRENRKVARWSFSQHVKSGREEHVSFLRRVTEIKIRSAVSRATQPPRHSLSLVAKEPLILLHIGRACPPFSRLPSLSLPSPFYIMHFTRCTCARRGSPFPLPLPVLP